MGRPAKYKTAEELQEAIDSYFLDIEDEMPTVSGLAYHLGFADRNSIYDYAHKDEFSRTIKRAILGIERLYEAQLVNGKSNTAGVIFWLKNQGWRDTHTLDDVSDRKPQRIDINFLEASDDS